MCAWNTTTPIWVIVPAHLSYTGKRRSSLKPIDYCIAGIVEALNKNNIVTVTSCCGHGKGNGSILLEDGRELIIHSKQKTLYESLT